MKKTDLFKHLKLEHSSYTFAFVNSSSIYFPEKFYKEEVIFFSLSVFVS